MEDRDEVKLLMTKITTEAEKTVRHIEILKVKATKLAQKGETIIDPDLKQRVRKEAIAELEEITEKLVALNIDLELDYVDCPNFLIPYFTPGENTIHKLKFLSGDNPYNFWVIDPTVDTKEILKNLLEKHKYGLLDPVTKPKTSQSVCFIDRHKVIRGVILQVKNNETRVKLLDCDSNVTKVVSCDKLFKVDQDTCCVHASALKCTITEEPDAIELWNNSDLRDIFCNTLREATLGVKILKRIAGSFPMFVVDVELQNDDEESTASLREWIMDRLLPELKKLGSSENEPVCDFLSEESLSPYHKGMTDDVLNKNLPQAIVCELNRSSDQDKEENVQIQTEAEQDKEENVQIQTEELNNLNSPSDKLSEKIFTTFSQSKGENYPSQDIKNNSELKVSISSEQEITSSSVGDDVVTSSSKESFLSASSHKTETVSDIRLNCHTEEFRPKTKKSDIPRFNRKYENQRNPPQYTQQPYPIYGPVEYIRPPVPHLVQQWAYPGQPFHQITNWSYQQQMSQPPQPTWSPGQDTSAFCPVNPESNKVPNMNKSNEVNVLAPEFVPRNCTAQSSSNSNKVQLPKEPITLRKSATLIKENENLLVFISHVESPSEFYVHFVNHNNTYLDKLFEDMFTYYSIREKIVFDSWQEARTKLGKFCACKWLFDNRWYRVEVLEWAVGIDQVKVFFVDYGNTICVPLSCLQPLIKPFEKLPICSQACHLAEVHPRVKGQPWSKEAIEFFKSKLEVDNSHAYSVTVGQSNGARPVKANSFSVLLYEGKAADSSKSINGLLVEKGLAWSRSLQVDSYSSMSSEKYHSLDDISDKLTNNLPTCDYDLPIQALHTEGISLCTPESNMSLHISPTFERVPDLDCDFEEWDPRREDYESVRNNPALDTDDPCVAVSGYSARDESRICKFFARDKRCFKTVCSKEHSMPNPDGVTTDKEEVFIKPYSQLKLPEVGEVVKLRVTSVHNVNLFYAQIEEKKAVAVDTDTYETLTSLEEYMNQQENVMTMKYLIVPPGPGHLVLAREIDEENGTEWWYRARVTSSSNDILDDDNPEIMFVDYGSTSIVSERDLRRMEGKYLHLPFQAIECSLANILPLEMDSKAMAEATKLLQDELLGQVLKAKVYERMDMENFKQMDVVLESKELGDIGEFLIALGYASAYQLNWHQAISSDTPMYKPG